MARRKKGKSQNRGSAARKIEKAAAPVIDSGGQVESAKPIRKTISSQSVAPPIGANARGRVRVSTCVAGMFLTLVLGMYLGTLLPGVLADMQHAGHEQASVENASLPVENPPVQKTSPLDKDVARLEQKALANPNSAEDWINLGNIYFDAQRPQDSINAYEHGLALAPDNPDALTDMGIMYREIGKYDKALECFRKAIAISPGHQNAMFNEGVVLAMDLHKKDEAVAVWKRLLEISPHAASPTGMPLAEMIKNLQ